jgi:hypothetical protein
LKALLLPTSSKTVPFSVFKNIFIILNQYILAASVALCIIHTLLCLQCPLRSKLGFASAEALNNWR